MLETRCGEIDTYGFISYGIRVLTKTLMLLGGNKLTHRVIIPTQNHKLLIMDLTTNSAAAGGYLSKFSVS